MSLPYFERKHALGLTLFVTQTYFFQYKEALYQSKHNLWGINCTFMLCECTFWTLEYTKPHPPPTHRPSPPKPCFRPNVCPMDAEVPGNTPALPCTHSTYRAVLIHYENQDHNALKLDHGTAVTWMSSRSLCSPALFPCHLWPNIRCWRTSYNRHGWQTASLNHAVPILLLVFLVQPPLPSPFSFIPPLSVLLVASHFHRVPKTMLHQTVTRPHKTEWRQMTNPKDYHSSQLST